MRNNNLVILSMSLAFVCAIMLGMAIGMSWAKNQSGRAQLEKENRLLREIISNQVPCGE